MFGKADSRTPVEKKNKLREKRKKRIWFLRKSKVPFGQCPARVSGILKKILKKTKGG